VAFLLGAVLTAHAAGATTVVRKDLRALCSEADRIFVGHVVAIRSQWAEAGQRAIETLVTVTNEQTLRGGEEPEITLSFAGGQLGSLSERIAGAPRFTEGERVILFVRNGRWVSPIVGFQQGYFRVREAPTGPRVHDAFGRPIRSFKDGLIRSGEGGTGSALSLESFLARVRGELGSESRGR